MSKRILLCLVEGISDKDSLGLLFSQLFKEYSVEFYIVKGDVTSEFKSNVSNIESKIKRFVSLFLKENRGFKKDDIDRIIHFSDLDGVFIDPSQVIYSKEAYANQYGDDVVVSNKVDQIIERNIRKKSILNKLMKVESIWNIPYEIYYFSCHLEHVLHNLMNVEREMKEDLSVAFIDKYLNHEEEFVLFLKNLLISEDYTLSWELIKEDNHSIHRYSNVFILIDGIMNGRKDNDKQT